MCTFSVLSHVKRDTLGRVGLHALTTTVLLFMKKEGAKRQNAWWKALLFSFFAFKFGGVARSPYLCARS